MKQYSKKGKDGKMQYWYSHKVGDAWCHGTAVKDDEEYISEEEEIEERSVPW